MKGNTKNLHCTCVYTYLRSLISVQQITYKNIMSIKTRQFKNVRGNMAARRLIVCAVRMGRASYAAFCIEISTWYSASEAPVYRSLGRALIIVST